MEARSSYPAKKHFNDILINYTLKMWKNNVKTFSTSVGKREFSADERKVQPTERFFSRIARISGNTFNENTFCVP